MIGHALHASRRYLLPALRFRPLWMALGGSTALGLVTGWLIAYTPEAEIVDALRDYHPSVITRIHDDRELPFAEWSLERRELFGFEDIPEVMVNAVISIEDSRFFSHVGIDPWAVFRSALADLRCGYFCEGFSTITMQIPRNLDLRLGGDTWLPKNKTLERKVREAIYAIQIERHYPKEQIFAFYANQIYMGYNTYGFQAAARYYFGKTIAEVDLPEAAMLAGIIQRPADYNPHLHPKAALHRRNTVLDRMHAEGYVSDDELAEAKATPINLGEASPDRDIAAYFKEEIRKQLIQLYGTNGIYRSGLEVYTTLDRELQIAAETSLDWGLREIDKRQGWRGDQRNLRSEGLDPETFSDPRWRFALSAGDIVPAVVMQVSTAAARLRIDEEIIELAIEDAGWTRAQSMSSLLRIGDVISVLLSSVPGDVLEETGEAATTYAVSLDQEPQAQGGILVIENRTGEVKALVGGRDFDENKFNRATQAVRQTGSIFKPFVFTASLLQGLTAGHVLVDQPTTFRDPTTREPYAPRNFGNEYVGATTSAEALSKSRNVSTLKLQETVGVNNVIATAHAFGISAPLRPYLALGLGVIDVSLWEIARAYSVFPNQGVLIRPHLLRRVLARDGRELLREQPEASDVLDADVAYVVARMMVAGIERGTGAAARGIARELQLPLGGKSGTTDDYTDAWYVGFSPYHTVAVWVGHDEKVTLGNLETGSRAALPIWMRVMRSAERDARPTRFTRPGNVVLRTIDPYTGLLHGPYCQERLEVGYLEGTAPTRTCGQTEHAILGLPHYQQDYFIRDGRIEGGDRY